MLFRSALLLAYASLLAAAVGLGSPEPGAPSGSRARDEPPPGNELPAGPAARPPVRRRPARPGPGDLGPQPPRPQLAPLAPRAPRACFRGDGERGVASPRGPGLARLSSLQGRGKRLACGLGTGGLGAGPLPSPAP